jgi:hypothetical protein
MANPLKGVIAFSDLEPGDELEIVGEGIDGKAIIAQVYPDELIIVFVQSNTDDDRPPEVIQVLGTLECLHAETALERQFYPSRLIISTLGHWLLILKVSSLKPEAPMFNGIKVTRQGKVIFDLTAEVKAEAETA